MNTQLWKLIIEINSTWLNIWVSWTHCVSNEPSRKSEIYLSFDNSSRINNCSGISCVPNANFAWLSLAYVHRSNCLMVIFLIWLIEIFFKRNQNSSMVLESSILRYFDGAIGPKAFWFQKVLYNCSFKRVSSTHKRPKRQPLSFVKIIKLLKFFRWYKYTAIARNRLGLIAKVTLSVIES